MTMTETFRIAVASRDGKTVAGHIGKCRNRIVFEVSQDSEDSTPWLQEVD